MQRTTDRVPVFVSDEKIPLVLTDSAVEALQGEAAGKATEAFDAILDVADSDPERVQIGRPMLFAAELPQWKLSELREQVTQLGLALDVLWYCRPEEYEDGSEGESDEA